MSKKRKHSVRKMTEEDYQNYIMSLKDERPAKVILENGEDKKED